MHQSFGVAAVATIVFTAASAVSGQVGKSTLSDSQITSRYPGEDDWGKDVCIYRAVPELLLEPNYRRGPLGRFQMAPNGEGKDSWSSFLVEFMEGKPVSAKLMLLDDSHKSHEVSQIVATVDGRQAFIWKAIHPFERIGPPMTFKSFVSHDGLTSSELATLVRGSNLHFALKDKAGGTVTKWTFDVSRLRYAPRALQLSKWGC